MSHYAPHQRAPIAPGPLSAAAAGAAPTSSAFFPHVRSLLAAPAARITQDLTEETTLGVSLQLFLEQLSPGQPPLRLEDFLVSIPGSRHIPAEPLGGPGTTTP